MECCLCLTLFQDDYSLESLRREFASKVNSFKETLNRSQNGFPLLEAAKQAILDILLTANEYNLGEKTTKKWGKILKRVNFMSKNCPNIPSNINRALSDLALRFRAKGGLSQKEMKWANKAVQSRQMDLFNTQMHMGPQQHFYPHYNRFGQPPWGR